MNLEHHALLNLILGGISWQFQVPAALVRGKESRCRLNGRKALFTLNDHLHILAKSTFLCPTKSVLYCFAPEGNGDVVSDSLQ